MTLELPGRKVLLINSYFPQDPQHDNFDEQDLLGCLTTMKSLIENHPHDQLIILFLDHSYSSPCCTHFSLVVHFMFDSGTLEKRLRLKMKQRHSGLLDIYQYLCQLSYRDFSLGLKFIFV